MFEALETIEQGVEMSESGSKKNKPKLMVVKPEKGLTAKQERFAQLVAQGQYSYSKCYELAGYEIANMKRKSVNELASRLKVVVTSRVNEIIEANKGLERSRADTLKNYVENKLMEIVESSEQDSNKVAALSLLGRSVSMFSDKIIEESSDNKSVFELEEQLKQKLEKLKVI